MFQDFSNLMPKIATGYLSEKNLEMFQDFSNLMSKIATVYPNEINLKIFQNLGKRLSRAKTTKNMTIMDTVMIYFLRWLFITAINSLRKAGTR